MDAFLGLRQESLSRVCCARCCVARTFAGQVNFNPLTAPEPAFSCHIRERRINLTYLSVHETHGTVRSFFRIGKRKERVMRTALIAAGVALVGLSATAANAQWRDRGSSSSSWRYERAIQQTQRECAQALRRADSRREYYRVDRRCDARLAELRHEYAQSLSHHRGGHWDQDNRWSGRDRYDDHRWRGGDDNRNWRGRDRDDDDDDDDDD